MSTSPKIKFGVIGCSRIALKGALPAMVDSEYAELAMVGSRSEEKAKEVAEQFSCGAWGTYDDIVNNKEINAIYVSLPNSMHEEWSIKALNAGKHVWCEKPAATSFDAAKNMTRAARENGVRLIEGFMFRYHPQHTKIKKIIKEGTLGDPLRFEGCFGYPFPPQESIAIKKELQGGSFYNAGGYPVAASRMIFEEEPLSVFATLKEDPNSGVNTGADALLFYSKGKMALISSLFGSYFQSTYSVLGSEAYIKAARAYAVPRDMSTKIYLDKDDVVEEMIIEPADHFRLMLDDFCKEVAKGGASTKKYEEDILDQARVIEAIKLSSKENRPVKISEMR